MRCFVGIPLGDRVTDSLLDACKILRDIDPTWRDDKWVSEDALHITVKFLGELPEDDAVEASEAVGASVAGVRAFHLPLTGVRAVPNLRRCRMLWASFLDPDGRCSTLAEAVESASLAFGVPPDERTFKPHATLCRARRPKRLAEDAFGAANERLSTGPELSVSVPQVTFFSSRLTPRGPVYTAIGNWPLAGE